MASESAMNGTFVPQNGYGSIDQSGYTAPSYPSSAPSQSNNSAADIPKDEVGWYFVEQYYTTLSRSPEKVYLFYNKRSQFVSGNETEKVEVCVGQRAINERIKELDFSECKVRVTNVDSQASDDHIVIQVIGEISNKSAPHKKFTQTFVLAAQTNGYFVLNDIFRYIIEEEDEAEATEESAAIQEPASTAVQEPEHETLTSSEDPVAIEEDAAKVDKEIEEKILADKPEETAAPTAVVNDSPKVEAAEPAQAETPAAAAAAESTEAPEAVPEAATETAASEVPVAQELETEKPKDPEPTPAVRSPVKQAAQPAKAAAPAKPVAPAAPAAPKTWANLAAAAHRVATPVVAPQPSASAAPVQPKTAPQPEPAAKSTPAAPAQEAAAAPARESSPAAPSADQQEEWTSVGDKKQNKGQAAAGAQDTPQYRAYVKNVHESITLPTLREAIEKHGELQYFDANRPKNCAFVDFKTLDGYKAALKASPISIGEHAITIEERRPKDNRPFFQGNRGGARGGRGGANQAPRGSFQGGRGGGSQRGRGGAASRGRGGAQAA
ncbi:NTF2-like protein, partial [Aureobasidium melanogenum]